MSVPRHYKSYSGISIEDLIDWYDEADPMEEESPHLLASISFSGFDEDCESPHPPCIQNQNVTRNERDDPLSRRDFVTQPSPLVNFVRKIYPDGGTSIESLRLPVSNAPTFTLASASKIPRHISFSDKSHRTTSESSIQTDCSDQSMSICDNKSAPPRHRRDSVESLPDDLQKLLKE
jgi:hypothetical protein